MLTIKRKQTLFSRFTIGTSVLPFADMAWWAQTIAVIIKKINYTLQKRVVTCKKKNSCEQGLQTTIVDINIFTAGWTMTQYFLMSVYVYLLILMHYGWVSCLWTKDIDLRHQGQFLPPDSQIRTNIVLTCSITKIHFNFHENIPKRRGVMTLCSDEIKTHEYCCF